MLFYTLQLGRAINSRSAYNPRVIRADRRSALATTSGEDFGRSSRLVEITLDDDSTLGTRKGGRKNRQPASGSSLGCASGKQTIVKIVHFIATTYKAIKHRLAKGTVRSFTFLTIARNADAITRRRSNRKGLPRCSLRSVYAFTLSDTLGLNFLLSSSAFTEN